MTLRPSVRFILDPTQLRRALQEKSERIVLCGRRRGTYTTRLALRSPRLWHKRALSAGPPIILSRAGTVISRAKSRSNPASEISLFQNREPASFGRPPHCCRWYRKQWRLHPEQTKAAAGVLSWVGAVSVLYWHVVKTTLQTSRQTRTPDLLRVKNVASFGSMISIAFSVFSTGWGVCFSLNQQAQQPQQMGF